MNTDPNTLLAALYVKIDNKVGRTRCPGGPPLLSGSDLVSLAVVELHPHRLRHPDREHALQAQGPTPEGLPEPTTKKTAAKKTTKKQPAKKTAAKKATARKSRSA